MTSVATNTSGGAAISASPFPFPAAPPPPDQVSLGCESADNCVYFDVSDREIWVTLLVYASLGCCLLVLFGVVRMKMPIYFGRRRLRNLVWHNANKGAWFSSSPLAPFLCPVSVPPPAPRSPPSSLCTHTHANAHTRHLSHLTTRGCGGPHDCSPNTYHFLQNVPPVIPDSNPPTFVSSVLVLKETAHRRCVVWYTFVGDRVCAMCAKTRFVNVASRSRCVALPPYATTHRPPPLPRPDGTWTDAVFGWMEHVLRVPDKELIATAGIDALAFIRVCQFGRVQREQTSVSSKYRAKRSTDSRADRNSPTPLPLSPDPNTSCARIHTP